MGIDLDIRELERRVLAGDLSLVRDLADLYDARDGGARTTWSAIRSLASRSAAVEGPLSYDEAVRYAAELVRATHDYEPVETTLARHDIGQTIDDCFAYQTWRGDGSEADLNLADVALNLFAPFGKEDDGASADHDFHQLQQDLRGGARRAIRVFARSFQDRIRADVRREMRRGAG